MSECPNGNDYQGLKENDKPVVSVVCRSCKKLGLSRSPPLELAKAHGSEKDEGLNVWIRLID